MALDLSTRRIAARQPFGGAPKGKATQDAIKTWRRYVSVAQRLPTEREYVQTAQAQLERLTQGANTP